MLAIVALVALAAPLPALQRPPRVDGDLADWKSVRPVLDASGTRVMAGHARGHLYLAVQATAPSSDADGVTISLAFRDAGPLAQGYEWGFSSAGARRAPRSPAVAEVPAHALEAARAAGRRRAGGYALEFALPARALPRFPAKGPWTAELCVLTDPAAGSDCSPVALQVPASLTTGALPAKPPSSVAAVEGVRGGWVGYGEGASPAWIAADGPLDPSRVRGLLGAPDPASAGINLPDRLFLPGGAPLVAAVVGSNPFGADGACEPGRALRLVLFRVGAKGRAADRVLDWTAADCALGRLRSMQLDEEGELTLGYTGGATALFLWSKDHFERIQIGSR